MGSHHTPCPRIDCPRLLRCRTDARWSALRRRTLTTQRAPSGCRLAVPTSRPPPLAATGSFGLTCRTATGITEPTVRCVVYIHSFPTTSRTQEGGFSAQRDESSCSGRLHHGGPGWGPKEGSTAADRHLDNSESTGLPLDNSEFRSGLPYLATALRPSGALAAPPHRAQSSVRVNANRDSLSHAQAGAFFPSACPPSIPSDRWPPSPHSP